MENQLEKYQRVYAEVDLSAIRDNMIHMKEHIAPETKMIGVIKTDGYGHGSVRIARELEKLDFMFGFAVATAEEAHILRMTGTKLPILILGYTFPYCYEMLAEEAIRPAVFREDMLQELDDVAKKTGKKIKVHVKVDTGMGRIGIRPDETGLVFIEKLLQFENLELEGMFTHFAKADEYDKANVNGQIARFKGFLEMVEKHFDIRIPVKHCSNSAGILELPDANMDVVRAGITLYGLYPSDEVSKDAVPLAPALSLYSHIVYIKTLKKGESVSYGGTYTASEDRVIATVPVGYGDGYPRMLSNKGYVLVRGKKAPIVGRVCMDQFMIDVTGMDDVQMGTKVTLIGFDGDEHISAELLGDLSGRFNYELVCDLGKRIPRVFVLDGKIIGTRDYSEDYR